MKNVVSFFNFFAMLIVVVCSYVGISEVVGRNFAFAVDNGQQVVVEIEKVNERLLKSDTGKVVNKIMLNIKNDWSNFQNKEGSIESKTYQKSLSATLESLREVEKNASIQGILAVERAILLFEGKTVVNSPEMLDSNKWALVGMEEAFTCINYLANKSRYAAVVPAFSISDTQNGLPLDAFRKFVRSHSSRLTEQLRSVSSELEKEIVRQRKENLATAERLYINYQVKALQTP